MRLAQRLKNPLCWAPPPPGEGNLQIRDLPSLSSPGTIFLIHVPHPLSLPEDLRGGDEGEFRGRAERSSLLPPTLRGPVRTQSLSPPPVLSPQP